MTLQQDLLEQAENLVTSSKPGPSKQANLRRAVSAAYYALFHQFTADATFSHISNVSGLREVSRRSLGHGQMKDACKAFLSYNPPKKREVKNFVDLINPPLDTDLKFVLEAFIELQAARHNADYNTLIPQSRSDALRLVSKAKEAHSKWTKASGIGSTANAKILMAAFMLKPRLG